MVSQKKKDQPTNQPHQSGMLTHIIPVEKALLGSHNWKKREVELKFGSKGVQRK